MVSRKYRGVFAVALASVLAVSASVPPALGANTGDDYPSWLKDQPKDAVLDPWAFYNRNCTSFAAWRLNQQAGTTSSPWAFQNTMAGLNGVQVKFGHANTWDDAARNGGWLVDQFPEVGSIAQSDAGYYGHVGVVKSIQGDGSVVVEDYNKANTGAYGNHVAPIGNYRYLHIHNQSPVGKFVGDWDGNGSTTIGVVYRTSSGLAWHLRNSNSAGAAWTSFYYGDGSDIPVVGNWDGVGGDTIGIARRTTSGMAWHLRNYNSAGPANMAFYYGIITDSPIVGDWDGVGGDTMSIVRKTASGMQWHLRNYNSAGAAQAVFLYGDQRPIR